VPGLTARTHLTEDEAREAIKTFRSEKLRKDEELFTDLPKRKDEEGVVAVTRGKESNVFGINSTLRSYTAEDRIAADQLRDKLIQKYPDVTKRGNIGWKPNNAVYHAETTLLLRLANEEEGGSLAGQTFVVHVDADKLCPSCRKLLPYIGLELGNPTVTFIDRRGRRLTMQNGQPLK
jgi:hypothetical protein